MLAMVCRVKVWRLWYISTYISLCTLHVCKSFSTSTCIKAHYCFGKRQLGGDLLHQKALICFGSPLHILQLGFKPCIWRNLLSFNDREVLLIVWALQLWDEFKEENQCLILYFSCLWENLNDLWGQQKYCCRPRPFVVGGFLSKMSFFKKNRRWTRWTLSAPGIQTQYWGEEVMGIQGWEALGPWLVLWTYHMRWKFFRRGRVCTKALLLLM